MLRGVVDAVAGKPQAHAGLDEEPAIHPRAKLAETQHERGPDGSRAFDCGADPGDFDAGIDLSVDANASIDHESAAREVVALAAADATVTASRHHAASGRKPEGTSWRRPAEGRRGRARRDLAATTHLSQGW